MTHLKDMADANPALGGADFNLDLADYRRGDIIKVTQYDKLIGYFFVETHNGAPFHHKDTPTEGGLNVRGGDAVRYHVTQPDPGMTGPWRLSGIKTLPDCQVGRLARAFETPMPVAVAMLGEHYREWCRDDQWGGGLIYSDFHSPGYAQKWFSFNDKEIAEWLTRNR